MLSIFQHNHSCALPQRRARRCKQDVLNPAAVSNPHGPGAGAGLLCVRV